MVYGRSGGSSMAAVCERAGEPSTHGQAQCLDPRRPLVAGGEQHGAGMEDTAQPPSTQEQRLRDGQADVEGVRPSSGPYRSHKGEPCEKERLAPVGFSTGERREPVHTQEGSPLGEAPSPWGAVSIENVLRLLEHQHYRCALTGRALTPQMAALDHIVPIRYGGGHVIENTQVLHKDVNRAKGSLTSQEFIGLCREVARWADAPTTGTESQ